VRDYLTHKKYKKSVGFKKAIKNDKAAQIMAFEKKIDEDKKLERQQKLIAEQKASVLQKKQEQERKIIEDIAKERGQMKIRNAHQRTAKPMEKKKVEDSLAKFTEGELDYLLYVDGYSREMIKSLDAKLPSSTIKNIY